MAKFKSKPKKSIDQPRSSALLTKRSGGKDSSSGTEATSDTSTPPQPQPPPAPRRENQTAGGRERERAPGQQQQTRQKKRVKPGVAALREIKRLQKSTDLVIPKAPFLRIVS